MALNDMVFNAVSFFESEIQISHIAQNFLRANFPATPFYIAGIAYL